MTATTQDLFKEHGQGWYLWLSVDRANAATDKAAHIRNGLFPYEMADGSIVYTNAATRGIRDRKPAHTEIFSNGFSDNEGYTLVGVLIRRRIYQTEEQASQYATLLQKLVSSDGLPTPDDIGRGIEERNEVLRSIVQVLPAC